MKKQMTTLSIVREVHGSDFTETPLDVQVSRKYPTFSFTFSCGATAQGQGADALVMGEKCVVHKRRLRSRTLSKN
jgi:hypothetical protein